jgi:putative ABC transport system permease protein
MRFLIHDISFSVRLLRRHPLETALAVSALALGVGLSTAIFSILWGTVLRGLPFNDAERLVRIETISQGEKATPTDRDFLAWRRNQHSFEEVAAFLGGSFNVSGGGEPAGRYNGSNVSANIFRIVQIHPLLGRDFQEADEVPGAPLVAIISEGLWKKQFNRDPNIIGKPVKLNGEPAQVVGVMAGDFGFPLRQEIWAPLQLDPRPGRPGRIQVLGKLKEGVSRRQAAADLQASSAPQSDQKTVPGIRVTPYVSAYTEDLQPALYLLLYASLGLLLVVSVNVSGLLAAQTITRLPELAIRSAVGATPSRLLVQRMTEAALLALIGALLSLPLAAAAIRVYVDSQGGELRSFWMDIRLDAPSVLYALAMTVLVGSISAVAPSLQVTGGRLNDVLKKGAGKGAGRPPGALSGIGLTVQLALSFALLIATGLIIVSLNHMSRLNFGASPETVYTAHVLLPNVTYRTSEEKVLFFHAVQKRLEEALGPGQAAFASALPGGATDDADVEIEEQPRSPGNASSTVPYLIVSPDYFPVLRLAALQGRLFEAGDDADGLPAAVVNQSFVRRYFGNRPAVGARFRFLTSTGPGKWRTILGSVPDMTVGTPPFAHPEAVYLPMDQVPVGWMSILLRISEKDRQMIAKELRQAVSTVDPEVPVFWPGTLQEQLDETRQPLKAMARAFVAFGGAALFLSLVGVYGVTSRHVASRSREMAIRLALGGQKRDLLLLVLRTTLFKVAAGIALGILLSFATSRFLESILFGVQPREPGIFSGITMLVFLAGLLACFFPAARIFRAEPAEILRGE